VTLKFNHSDMPKQDRLGERHGSIAALVVLIHHFGPVLAQVRIDIIPIRICHLHDTQQLGLDVASHLVESCLVSVEDVEAMTLHVGEGFQEVEITSGEL
jgi:hypothetical protein